MAKCIEKLGSKLEYLGAYLKQKAAKNEVPQEAQYFSLSPIVSADPEKHYSNALNWALTNRKKLNIKNIAVTGPYGSGKSSVLHTFQRLNQTKDLSFLNISLATFKDEVGDDSKTTNKDDLLRLIELSILTNILS